MDKRRLKKHDDWLLGVWDSDGRRYKVPRFKCHFCWQIKCGESYSVVDCAEQEEQIGFVIFSDDDTGWRLSNNDGEIFRHDEFGYIEKIGNIYENPELIEAGGE